MIFFVENEIVEEFTIEKCEIDLYLILSTPTQILNLKSWLGVRLNDQRKNAVQKKKYPLKGCIVVKLSK